MRGRVYLIGAGCGEADLLTLRGLARLSACDCVVYDELIDPAILDMAPPDARRISMGKRSGRHSADQREINDTLIALARAGHTVARLKGGDPLVFGRGGEEAIALRAAGIPFEIVPGISSSVAIPAWAGIPVTHRGLSRSFHVITGRTADTQDALPAELSLPAGASGTLVILMGLSKLKQIAQALVANGRSGDTPAAVISGGNSPNPAAVRGTLADIAEKAAGVLPPAVIVVGETAALDLSPSLPLSGVRVGVVGSSRMAEKLTGLLRAEGASVRRLCRTAVEALPPDPILNRLTDAAAKWAVLTSPNGVEVLFRQLREAGIDLRRLSRCRFAAIGPATREALEARGIFPDLCPDGHTSEALAHALTAAAAPEEAIFLLRSKKGSPLLLELPQKAGLSVYDVPLYDTVPLPDADVSAEGLHFLLFASGEGVRDFFRRYAALPAGARCVCIGPVTAKALAQYTDAAPILAADTTAEEMARAVAEHL